MSSGHFFKKQVLSDNLSSRQLWGSEEDRSAPSLCLSHLGVLFVSISRAGAGGGLGTHDRT